MQQFKNILFVADGGTHEKLALTRATALAGENRASLTAISVIKEKSSNSNIELSKDILIKQRRQELEQLINVVASKYSTVCTHIKILAGETLIEIIKAVLHNKYDLVVKVRKESMGPIQMIFDSTDLKLMRKCPCPIWLIKPTTHKRYTRILATVDPVTENHESLNHLILDLATSIAEAEKSELHVVHAWQLKSESILRGGHIPKRELNKVIKEMYLATQHQLDLLLSHYKAHKKTAHLIQGLPVEVIPALAEKIDVDLIVMGTVGRSGMPGLFIGNTSEKILSKVDCSILAVKPEGFSVSV